MKLTDSLKRSLGGIFLSSVCMAGCINTRTCLRNDDTGWMSSDSIVFNQLGKNLTDILFSPDSVKCYYLLHKDSIGEKDTLAIKGYVRDGLLAILDEKQTGVLQYVLLSNKGSYSRDSVKIEAPYMPIIEYEFLKKEYAPASVILSTSDRSWSVFYDGKERFSHNYIDSRVVERFCDYFLDMYNEKIEKR